MSRVKLIRITTVPQSLRGLLSGQMRYMADNGFHVMGISSPGEILEEVQQNEGVPVIPVQMTRKISPIKDLKAAWYLYKIFKKEKPQIVHTHTPKAGTVGMLAAKLAGVPNRLHTVAGLPLLVAKGNKRKLLDGVEKITYACATRVYPNSKGLYDIILQNKYTGKDKLKVIGNGSSNGIDTKYFDPDLYNEKDKQELRKKLGIQEDDFVFVFVGRLVGDKGINELIRAFDLINQRHHNIKLLLVGPLEDKLDPLASETLDLMNNNSNIISVGTQRDVRPYFAISDVLTFPSYREGFPNVVLQAGAMGLPSIVSDINGCNEIIVKERNGIIIPVRDSQALAKAMERLLKDSALREKLRIEARILIENRYQRSLIWQELLSEYRSVLQ